MTNPDLDQLTPRDLVQQLLELGLTQQEIADRSGIAQPTVSKIHRGDVKDVLSRNFLALKTALQEKLAEKAKAA